MPRYAQIAIVIGNALHHASPRMHPIHMLIIVHCNEVFSILSDTINRLSDASMCMLSSLAQANAAEVLSPCARADAALCLLPVPGGVALRFGGAGSGAGAGTVGLAKKAVNDCSPASASLSRDDSDALAFE